MLDHSVQAKPNAAKAAQTINKHKSDIAAIYKNSKTQVAQAISEHVSQGGMALLTSHQPLLLRGLGASLRLGA